VNPAGASRWGGGAKCKSSRGQEVGACGWGWGGGQHVGALSFNPTSTSTRVCIQLMCIVARCHQVWKAFSAWMSVVHGLCPWSSVVAGCVLMGVSAQKQHEHLVTKSVSS